MTSDPSGERIDPNRLKHWAKKLGYPEGALQQAMRDVGCLVDAVKRRLKDRIGKTHREMEYWSREWGCPKDRLAAAMDAVGTYGDEVGGYSAKDVREWLSREQNRVQPNRGHVR